MLNFSKIGDADCMFSQFKIQFLMGHGDSYIHYLILWLKAHIIGPKQLFLALDLYNIAPEFKTSSSTCT